MSPHNTKPSGFSQFLAEMRRRHVGRFTIGYAAAAFVLLQLAEIVFPAFGLEDIWLRVLVIAVVLAFLPAVVLAWVFDLTPHGLQRTEDLPRSAAAEFSQGSLNARVALVVVSFLTVGGLGVWLMGTGALRPAEDPEAGGGPVALTDYDPTVPVTSLAVLALDDLTQGGGQEYFTTGMQEELIAQLSMVSGLRVASRTSAARYAGTPTLIPAIGRELGVDAIIEGSVRRDLTNDSVRITVQLIHAASDTHIWTGQYNRHFTDVLNLQSEVAVEIVRAVQGEISPEEENRMRYAADKSVTPEALDAYLRGNEAYEQGTPEGYKTAMGYFEEAVGADSGFAPAVAGLAGSRFMVTMDAPELSEVELERAHEEARRALELDPTSVEVLEVFTLIDANIDEVMPSHTTVATHDATESPRTQVIAIPGTTDSIVVNVQGMDSAWVGAMSRLGKALEMRVRRTPGPEGEAEDRAQQFMAARHLMSDGEFDVASGILEEMLDEQPGFMPGWEMLVKAEVASGDADGVVAAVVDWSDSGLPGAPNERAVEDLEDAVDESGMRGYWGWTLDRLETRASNGMPVSLVEQATAHAALGHTEEALRYLGESLRAGDRQLLTLQADPAWDGLRRHPQFQEIARQARSMRFAPTSRRPVGRN